MSDDKPDLNAIARKACGAHGPETALECRCEAIRAALEQAREQDRAETILDRSDTEFMASIEELHTLGASNSLVYWRVRARVEAMRAEIERTKKAIIAALDENTATKVLTLRIEELKADAERLAVALRQIERWRLPVAFGRDGRTSKYEVEYGSNGARDYIRGVARAALAAHEEGK